MKKKARGRPRSTSNDDLYIGFNVSQRLLKDFDAVCDSSYRTRTGQLKFLMEAAVKEYKNGK